MILRQDDYYFLSVATNKTRASVVKRFSNSNPTQQFKPVILGITACPFLKRNFVVNALFNTYPANVENRVSPECKQMADGI